MHIVGCTRWWHAHCPCTSSMHTMMSWHCVVSVIVQLLLSCETRWRWCNTCYGHTHMHRCWGRGATISKIHGLLGHGCEQYLHGIISIPHACLTFLWYMDMLEYPIFMDAPFRVSPLPFACRPCLAPWGDDYKNKWLIGSVWYATLKIWSYILSYIPGTQNLLVFPRLDLIRRVDLCT